MLSNPVRTMKEPAREWRQVVAELRQQGDRYKRLSISTKIIANRDHWLRESYRCHMLADKLETAARSSQSGELKR